MMQIFNITFSLLLSFMITVVAIPPVIRVANAKKLFDEVGGRKIHTRMIPPLGGVAIFIGFTLSAIITTSNDSFSMLKYIILAIIPLFFIGLKDDLINVSARKKFIVQIISALLLTIFGNIRVTQFHGLFGLDEVHYLLSVVVSVVIIVSVINAYNLIDGIDGLASGLAMLAALVFSYWFYMSGYHQHALVAAAITGSLSGFFIFNVFGKINKLFMGDTGSLVIGLILSVFAIQLNELTGISSGALALTVPPLVAFSILMIPLIDMLRVMSIRIAKGRSPFHADNKHLHHRLLVLIPNHLAVTIIIVSGNFLFIVLALFLNQTFLNINIQLLILASVALFSTFIPKWIISQLKPAQKEADYYPLGYIKRM